MPEISEKSECTTLNIEKGVIVPVLSNNVRNYLQGIKFKRYHKPRRKKFCFLCRSPTNSLLLILGAYVVIFLTASVILILSVLKLQNLSENEKLDTNIKTSENTYKVKYNKKPISNAFSETLFKEFVWPYRNSVFNCSSLSEVERFNYLTSGWTKNVFTFEHNGRSYALKTVNIEGIDMKNCMEKESNKSCFDKASSKMYKEYILSRELSHFNIVKVLAWCVSSNSFLSNVAIVTELCSPVDLIMLLRMSFQQRLKQVVHCVNSPDFVEQKIIILFLKLMRIWNKTRGNKKTYYWQIMLDLSQLIAYLAESPLGSVAINDFQLQQFVMCGDVLKLTDLDDLSIEEPKCSEHKHCQQKKLIADSEFDTNHTESFQLKCVNNLCIGYNEKQNVVNTYKHFVNLFLNITTPTALREDVEALFSSYISGASAKAVLKQTEFLYIRYKSLKNEVYNEKKFE